MPDSRITSSRPRRWPLLAAVTAALTLTAVPAPAATHAEFIVANVGDCEMRTQEVHCLTGYNPPPNTWSRLKGPSRAFRRFWRPTKEDRPISPAEDDGRARASGEVLEQEVGGTADGAVAELGVVRAWLDVEFRDRSGRVQRPVERP